jgi:hypothetical protein
MQTGPKKKKKKCENWIGKQETANHPWAASLKGTNRSFVCSQKIGRKGADAARRNLHTRNYKTAGIQ